MGRILYLWYKVTCQFLFNQLHSLHNKCFNFSLPVGFLFCDRRFWAILIFWRPILTRSYILLADKLFVMKRVQLIKKNRSSVSARTVQRVAIPKKNLLAIHHPAQYFSAGTISTRHVLNHNEVLTSHLILPRQLEHVLLAEKCWTFAIHG